LASLAYQALYAKGHRNLRILDEGIPGWIEQGHPTEGVVSGYVPDHARDYAAFLGGEAGRP
jgi:3-mercaptopyruvate sulfurtransferase SseA